MCAGYVRSKMRQEVIALQTAESCKLFLFCTENKHEINYGVRLVTLFIQLVRIRNSVSERIYFNNV